MGARPGAPPTAMRPRVLAFLRLNSGVAFELTGTRTVPAPPPSPRPWATRGAGGWYLDGLLAAGAGPALDEGVARVDDAADPVGIGVQLGLEGLVLLVLALKTPKTPTFPNQVLPVGWLSGSRDSRDGEQEGEANLKDPPARPPEGRSSGAGDLRQLLEQLDEPPGSETRESHTC